MVLELAGGVRRAGKVVAHGFGGEAGDSERLLPVLQSRDAAIDTQKLRRRGASVL